MRYIAAFCLILYLATSGSRAEPKSILGYSPEMMRPFYNTTSYRRDGPADWDGIFVKGDPLKVTSKIFSLLYEAHRDNNRLAAADAKKGLDRFISNWPNVTRSNDTFRWNYTYSHETKRPGWWSGMDSFLVVTVLIAASESFHDSGYTDLARRALKSALRSPLEGGSIWRDGDRCWISEYSWVGMKAGDESYVLNGHLFGLQALKMAADALRDEGAETAYQCAVRGIAEKANSFSIPNWTLYSLSKRTIDPAHYVVFELAQFQSLFLMTGEEIFEEEAKRRQEIFKSQYPMYALEDGAVFFAAAGAPEPFNLDIYTPAISCRTLDGERWEHRGKTNYVYPFLSRAFIKATPAKPISECDAISVMGGMPTVLYTTRPKAISSYLEPTNIHYEMSAGYDAERLDSEIAVISPLTVQESGPDNYQSTKATITVKGKFDFSNTGLFGIEVNSERSSLIGITLADDKGNSAFRYYQRLPADHPSVILLSKVGFPGYESLANVRTMTLTLYTDRKNMPDQTPFKFSIDGILNFNTSVALNKYLARSKYAVLEYQ